MHDLVEAKDMKVLDFDIETRRIGFHNGGRFNPDGCEVVILAAAWDNSPVQTWSLRSTWKQRDAVAIVTAFRDLYEEADMVTGHYIRKFDLPILNGACLEWGLPPLGRKLVLDTKIDLLDLGGLSQSQENLSALMTLEASKFHMHDNAWRSVARLTPEGLSLARERVVDDVIQHQELRGRLTGWLTPTVWSP